jgi:Signal peptidase (SPase) II
MCGAGVTASFAKEGSSRPFRSRAGGLSRSCWARAMPKQLPMLLRLSFVLAPALTLAAVDLTVKATFATKDWDYHQRSHAWSVLAVCLLAVVLLLALLPSRLVAVSAGIVAGGVLGNVVSAFRHGDRVPNPIVIGPFAFNLADVFILLGVPLLMFALARVSILHRERIDHFIPPRRWELALRRRLGL